MRIGPSLESAPFANVNSILISIFLFISEFEHDYQLEIGKAIETQSRIKYTFNEKVKLLGGDYEICSSIIFPELIRYSNFKETIENYLLSKLYMNFGKAYGDFSVGLFQMKPSFVEKLEIDLKKMNELNHLSFIWEYPSNLNQSDIRKIRFERLLDLSWQIDYLISFTLLLENYHNKNRTKFSNQTKEDKIKYFSTSYNSGCWYNTEKIIQLSSLDYFPYGKHSFRNHLNYSQISSYYYKITFKS